MTHEKPVEKRHASWDVVRSWMHLAQIFLLFPHRRLPVNWHAQVTNEIIIFSAKKITITRFQTQANASRRVIRFSSLRHHHGRQLTRRRLLTAQIHHSLRHQDAISVLDLLESPAVPLPRIPHPRGARPRPRYPPPPLQLHSRIPTIAWTNAMR